MTDLDSLHNEGIELIIKGKSAETKMAQTINGLQAIELFYFHNKVRCSKVEDLHSDQSRLYRMDHRDGRERSLQRGRE